MWTHSTAMLDSCSVSEGAIYGLKCMLQSGQLHDLHVAPLTVPVKLEGWIAQHNGRGQGRCCRPVWPPAQLYKALTGGGPWLRTHQTTVGIVFRWHRRSARPCQRVF